MASQLLEFTSGGQRLISGNPWSGRQPPTLIEIRAAGTNSGSVYVGLSGGFTINSGRFGLSGASLMDGTPIAPGGLYTVPRSILHGSGTYNIFVNPDANCSGQARLYFEGRF